MAGLDAFVVLAVLGLVFGEVAPLAFAGAGYIGLASFLLGVSAPFVADRFFSSGSAKSSKRWANWIVAGGVLVHAFADGIALSSVDSLAGHDHGHAHDHGHGHGHGLGLVFAMVLHRIPVGLGIWMLAPHQSGSGATGSVFSARRSAILLLVAVALCSGLGQLLGKPALDLLGMKAEVFSAFSAGMLVHIVAHAPSRDEVDGSTRVSQDRATTLLACLGAALMWLGIHQTDASHGDHVHHAHPGWIFWVLPPALIAGVTIAHRKIDDKIIALASLATLVVGLGLGLHWGCVFALLGWALLYRPWTRGHSPGSVTWWQQLRPRAKALRDSALSGWIAGWILALGGALGGPGHTPAASDTSGPILLVLAAGLIVGMRPSLLLIGFPLLASLQVAPSWVVVALLAESCARSWPGREPGPWMRGMAAGGGALMGYLLDGSIHAWGSRLQALSGMQLNLAMLGLAALFLWLSASVGVRRWLAGGDFHRHPS